MNDELTVKRVASMIWHWGLHSDEELPANAPGWVAFLQRKHGETFSEAIIEAASVQCFRWMDAIENRETSDD